MAHRSVLRANFVCIIQCVPSQEGYIYIYIYVYVQCTQTEGLGAQSMLLDSTEREPLAFLYCEADKLLDALPILLLCGAAAVVLTWLTQRSLSLPHLLVHPCQPQPGEGQTDHTACCVRKRRGSGSICDC